MGIYILFTFTALIFYVILQLIFQNKIQMQLSEQEVVRREKLTKLRDLGINPYPANLYPVTHNSKQIKEALY